MANVTMQDFAKKIASILKTDRWVLIVCDGEMGEGKSCFTSQLSYEIAKETGTDFSYQDNMTYLRSELSKWVDGDDKGEQQKSEYSVILADEFISMFYKRNWFDKTQIDGIELLNKCRDRHLCVMGNIPNFWDLDSAVLPIITFWVHIHSRGRAWVFQKDRNPFTADKWHKRINYKLFRKGSPYRCKGFLFEVPFPDWTADEKALYYDIRNTKRVNTEGQREGKYKVEKYGKIKTQRDDLLKYLWIQKGHKLPVFTYQQLADISGLSRQSVSALIIGDQ